MDVSEYGYEVIKRENPYIIIKKKDLDNIADIEIVFDIEAKFISGGLITISPIQNLDDMSHIYKVFLDFQKDINKFAEMSGYDIILERNIEL